MAESSGLERSGNLRRGRGSHRGQLPRVVEADDLGEVAAEYLGAVAVGNVRELLRDDRLAAEEGALRVRVVTAPVDGLGAGDVPGHNGNLIVGELHPEVAPDVLARLERQRPA